MTEQEYRCPRPGCNKKLGAVTWLDEGRRIIVKTECKRCKRLVEVLVTREEVKTAA